MMFSNIASIFAKSEDGSATIWGLFTFSMTLIVGGYAVDVQNVMTERTRLQAVADSVAHAALLTRELHSENDSISAAALIAENNMPPVIYGSVLKDIDVVFGTWDAETKSFSASSGSREAVQVKLERSVGNDNGIPTFLLKLVGFDNWDVAVSSTFMAYNSSCFREGFVGQDEVDIQSNNSFQEGFCLHSNSYVSLNSNNYFEPGTVVSMPDVADLDIPNSGLETNLGLSAALRSGSYNIRIISRINDIIETVGNPGSLYYPSYLTNSTPLVITKSRITAADIPPGRVYLWKCSGGKGTIENDTIVDRVVIKTSCTVKFGAGVIVQDAVIANTSTDSKSFNASAGFQLGKNDNCATGGGAQLVTMGGVNFASQLQIYGSQILAKGNIEFSAQANGVEGAALVSGGTVSGTSNMSMAFCGGGMENNFEASYFRMVN